jgi:hypothetical protein
VWIDGGEADTAFVVQLPAVPSELDGTTKVAAPQQKPSRVIGIRCNQTEELKLPSGCCELPRGPVSASFQPANDTVFA